MHIVLHIAYAVTMCFGHNNHILINEQNPLQIVDLQGVSVVRPVRFERMAFRVGV